MHKSHFGWVLGLTLVLAAQAHAADLNLPSGGRVTLELISSDAAFHNTLSLISPAGAVIAFTGCQVESGTGLPGLQLMSEKASQHGCRVELDADGATPGIQPFPDGTTLVFNLCAQEDDDPSTCEHVWSSNPASNSDSFEHVHTTPLHPVELPNQVFQLSWEDKDGGGDKDFNDLIAVVRVNGDTDGDGLWDDWERFGIDTDGDGTVDLDLPSLGADPNHKDLFVEIDWMDCAVSGGDCASGDTHNHKPKAKAVAAVVSAFANAPVSNPDGTTGINLHVDLSNSIKHQNLLNIPGACFGGGSGIGNFDNVKKDNANFGTNNPRRFAYHYSLWTHQEVANNTTSGCGELPGNDFQVSLGGWNSGGGDPDGDGLPDKDVGTVSQQAGTFMHELGHNLGLGHGGGDGINRKPNYLSLMSYSFQIGGIPPTDPDGPTGPLTGKLDYSRALLSTLNELNLTESSGIGAGTTDNTFYSCPNFSGSSGVANAAIDWNCNGLRTDTAVSNDINGDRICVGAGNNGTLDTSAAGDDVVIGNQIADGPDRTCNTAVSGDDQQVRPVANVQPNLLNGFNDWSNLRLNVQSTAGFVDGAHPDSAHEELDFPTFQATLAADLSMKVEAAPSIVVTGSNVTYTLTVKNEHPDLATGVTVVDDLPATLTFVSCTSTGGGVCGGSGNHQTVQIPSIAGGASVTITLVANVVCATADGVLIADSATVQLATPDANPANDSAAALVITSNPPPVIGTVTPSPAALWPPDHKMVDVALSYTATDNCGPIVCSLTASSNEPILGTGSGDTAPDWLIVDDHHLQLRKERAGTGTGRIYTEGVTCTDTASNASSGSTVVTVAH